MAIGITTWPTPRLDDGHRRRFGDVENGYTYDVYGEPTVTGSLGNEFDFAGQQTDPSTGLQYLRAQYYDPVSGTFMSRDPMVKVPSWIEPGYSYGGSAPTTWSDPLGLCKFPVPWCWRAINESDVFGFTVDRADVSFEALFVGARHVPLYRMCLHHPDGNKECTSGYSQSAWLDWAYEHVPTAIGVTQAVIDVAEHIQRNGRTPWGQRARSDYHNDGRDGTQILLQFDSNGNRITYKEWDAVQRGQGPRGSERIVTGSDGSAWYTNDHYNTFTRIN